MKNRQFQTEVLFTSTNFMQPKLKSGWQKFITNNAEQKFIIFVLGALQFAFEATVSVLCTVQSSKVNEFVKLQFLHSQPVKLDCCNLQRLIVSSDDVMVT